jgi:hypothetical protein
VTAGIRVTDVSGYRSPKVGLATGEQGALVIATAPIEPGEVLFEFSGVVEPSPGRSGRMTTTAARS